MSENITQFKGKYNFLSNFYPCTIRVRGGRIFPSVEHLYQAAKTSDRDRQEEIRNTPSAGIAKRVGNLVPLREDWEEIKYNVMQSAVLMKFAQNTDLGEKLIDTYPLYLIEGNYWHDNYWGNCYCEKCKNIEGQNHLGEILMYVRDLRMKGRQD